MIKPARNQPDTPTLDSLHMLVGEDLEQVNQVILEAVDQDVPLITDIARHIIASGGKRIRPCLLLASARMLGYAGKRHIRLAAAVELIHTATLLHDDVVDASAMRRGESTANVIWSNQASVLVGDFLLSRAFQLMVADGSLDVLKILSDASATISQGEVMQMQTAHNPEIDDTRYFAVIGAKTATLFAAASELAAVLTGHHERRAAMQAIGLNLGMAFQLTDDALDYHAEEEKLGKETGDDFREGKVTLPVLLAYRAGDEAERGFWQRTIGEMRQEEADFTQAVAYIRVHRTVERTVEVAAGYCRDAAALLDTMPANPARSALYDVLDFCIRRGF